ncbi:MAG: hypothetical protein KGZ66_01850 [Selenomonadales bacterium]|nr:hypothetical protein [Selenomonadales bacterium]
MENYANATKTEKRDWRQWVLRDEFGREVSFKSAPGKYMTEMRRLLETGELGKCDFADVPGQEAAYRSTHQEVHATIDWTGLIEHSLDKLLGALNDMETGGAPTFSEVAKRYRGMLMGPVAESARELPLIAGLVCRYSMRTPEAWTLGVAGRCKTGTRDRGER